MANAEAWFLPGASAEHWLEELARCGLAEVTTRLFLVPRSLEDRTPAGLLAVPERVIPTERPAGIPCRLVAGKLYVPVDALLHPPVTDDEIKTLCPLTVSFLHPTLGLSAFDESSTRRVWNLLEAPEERPANWNAARAGVPPLPDIVAIQIALPPSLEELFGGAENEIGNEPLIDLPPAEGEPKDNAMAKSGRNLRKFLATGLAGAIERWPLRGSERTWLDDVHGWARKQLSGVNSQLDQLRNKELHRLMRLLEEDPDAGLRHAIPMNSFGHRGTAPPGVSLGSRAPNFDPSRLGGRATDHWNISANLQESLRQRYRELANRELRLGRHRRAAYIYAELLGDLRSAANTLKQGGYFREAALLYEEHLHAPVEAARCLADGGFYAEAAALFEKVGLGMELAELHERFGNQAAAQAVFRRVVDSLLNADDILGAAQLLEKRLHAPEEALERLLAAWPASRQAITCIATAFTLMGRLGKHELAQKTLHSMGSRELAPASIAPLLKALAEPARHYPDSAVRHRAADLSRVLIGRQLSRGALATEDAAELTSLLVRLAPEDRLLARDGNRFLALRRESEVRARRRVTAPPPLPGNPPTVIRRFELPRQIQWRRLRNEWHWFYALGSTPKRLTIIRGIWEGEQQSLSWPIEASLRFEEFLFEPSAERGALLTADVLERKAFPASDSFFNQKCVVGAADQVSGNACSAVTFTEDLVWTLNAGLDSIVLSCFSHRFKLIKTLDVSAALEEGTDRRSNPRYFIAAVKNIVAVATGNRLVLVEPAAQFEKSFTRLELPGEVTGLVPTLPHTRAGVAVLLEHGAVMQWLGQSGLMELDRDIPSPNAAFIPGGPLALAAADRMILLEVDSQGVHKVTRTNLPGSSCVGVCATSQPGQFALLNASGEMTVYRKPA